MSASMAVSHVIKQSGDLSVEISAPLSERELITRSQNGDRDAYGQLYLLHQTGVFRYAYRLLEDSDEADDVRQETFIRAFQSLSRFRGDSGFRTYLLAICTNICRDRMRQRHRHNTSSYGLEPGWNAFTDQENPQQHLEDHALAELVSKALSRMSADARELLILRHLEGLEIEEIAMILNCKKINVPVRLFRARQQFKDIYLSILREDEE